MDVSLRDLFAMVALHAAMTTKEYNFEGPEAATFAWYMADEMMKEKARELTAKDFEQRARWAAQARDERARKESEG